MSLHMRQQIVRSILVGGLACAVLDALDALVAYKVILGFDPIPIYQFVASGLLGPTAFSGGLSTALVGVAVHCLVAFTAATVFTLASVRLGWLRTYAGSTGPIFGLCVYGVMNDVVIPLSRIPPAPFSLPLFVNGVVGHALFVGLPIALATRHFLAAEEHAAVLPPTAATRLARS